MNKNLICFGSGLAVGVGATYLYLKNYYMRLLDQETENVKKYYDDMVNKLETASEEVIQNDVGELEVDIKEPKKAENERNKPISAPVTPDYGEIIDKLNYNQYSTKPKADTIVENNSENEPDGPYSISYELYSETSGKYETQLVSYFIEDDIVMYCDTDEMMDDPGKLIGFDNLADLRNIDDLEEMYVRNDYMGIDFHIIKETGTYEEYLAD